MIRIILPLPLCNLAGLQREVELDGEQLASISSVLDMLESRYPALCGTLRDQVTRQRRPFIRFFAMGEDLSMQSMTDPLPDEVLSGKAPLRVVGAMAGG